MKKMIVLTLLSLVFGVGIAAAQTEEDAAVMEGEMTSKVFQSQKMTTQVKTKNIIAKMVLKKVLKKYTEDNPALYNGSYNSTTIYKGKKIRVNATYNNSVTLTLPEGDKTKSITYFPYIKKGYYQLLDIAASKQQLEEMRKGEVEKTGETMEILGRKCNVYKVKYVMKQDTLGTISTTNIHNDYAICEECPADQEYVPDVKGAPLKFTLNTVSQTDNEMLNFDLRLSVSTLATEIKERAVDDSEFEVPSDIKLIDGNNDPQKMLKIMTENYEYMKKKDMWIDPKINEDKIYDNLSEDWDY